MYIYIWIQKFQNGAERDRNERRQKYERNIFLASFSQRDPRVPDTVNLISAEDAGELSIEEVLKVVDKGYNDKKN